MLRRYGKKSVAPRGRADLMIATTGCVVATWKWMSVLIAFTTWGEVMIMEAWNLSLGIVCMLF